MDYFQYGIYKLLPSFAKMLKTNLDKNGNTALTVKLYIEGFCDLFKNNNVFRGHEEHITRDELLINIWVREAVATIFLEREITIEGLDERLQFQCELLVSGIATQNSFRSRHKIQKDILGDFFTEDTGYMHFSDFKDAILLSDAAAPILESVPYSANIRCTSDH